MVKDRGEGAIDSVKPNASPLRGLYLVTDPRFIQERGLDLVYVVEQAVKAGVRVVQLRDKEASDADFTAQAQALLKRLAAYQVPLIINDRVHICQSIGAQGLHIGQSDGDPLSIRQKIGAQALLGISLESPADWVRAVEDSHTYFNQTGQQLFDYVALSPIFSTPTKTDTKSPWGLEGLSWAIRQRHNRQCQNIQQTCYLNWSIAVIGGVNRQNISAIKEHGADLFAIISDILDTTDIPARTQQFMSLIAR